MFNEHRNRAGLLRGLAGEDGFNLVEMMGVIGIISVLLALATLNFSAMSQKYHIESEVKEMQGDFDTLRVQAMTTKRNCTIVLNPQSYTFVSYSSESDPGHTISSKQVAFPIQQFNSGSYSAFSGTPLSIDARGCLANGSAPMYIAVAPGVSGPAVNAVAVRTGKTNVGLIQGVDCVLQ